MQFPRLTTRRLMVIVAAVALVLGTLVERSRQFRHESRRHVFSMKAARGGIFSGRVRLIDRHGQFLTDQESAKHHWHGYMAVKYGRAARSPWFLVPPDPPEPK